MQWTVLLMLALAFPLIGVATAGPKEDVTVATQEWADAFNSRDPERVLALYDPEAVLWGTVSPTIRDTPAALRDYFKGLPARPQGKVVLGEQRPRVYGRVAINTGYYTFQTCATASPSRFRRGSALRTISETAAG
jgi:hypothetical protein